MALKEPTRNGAGKPHGFDLSKLPPEVQIQVAYIEATARIGEVLDDIADSLSVLALVAEKFGKREALVTDEDLDGFDEEEDGPGVGEP